MSNTSIESLIQELHKSICTSNSSINPIATPTNSISMANLHGNNESNGGHRESDEDVES